MTGPSTLFLRWVRPAIGDTPASRRRLAIWDAPARRRWLAVLAVVVSGAAGVALSWSVAHSSLVLARWHLIVLIAEWVPAWLVGVWGLRRLPIRWAVVGILLLAVLLRVAATTGLTASITNDPQRYAWDAHVQLSGIDPYRYPPKSPQVAHLRTRGFWPSAERCAALGERPGCTVLARADVRTLYPPVAEAWFAVVGATDNLLNGHAPDTGGAQYRPWQLAAGLVDIVAILLMMILLRAQGRDPRFAAWYALSPVAVVEFAGNGHVDGVALALLLGALVALKRKRPLLAGVLIGAATMVKLYPGAALVAGWRQGRWRMLLGALSVVFVSEVPHVVAVGTRILGYLPGYLDEEHYSSGGRFLLLALLHLPGELTVVLAVACLLGAMAIVLKRHWSPESALALVLVVLIAVTTPVQPWYAVAVAGIALVAGAPLLLLVPLAVEAYYATVILDDPHQVLVGTLAYGVPLLVVAIAARWMVARGTAARRGQPLLLDVSAPRQL